MSKRNTNAPATTKLLAKRPVAGAAAKPYQIISGRAQQFLVEEVVLGMSFGKPGETRFPHNGFVAVGWETNGQLRFLEEHYGPWGEFLRALVDAKDRLLAQILYFFESDGWEFIEDLQDEDGLLRYKSEPTDRHGVPKWSQGAGTWPHFVARTHVAYVRPVPPQVQSQFDLGLYRLQRLIAAKELLVTDRRCQHLLTLLTQAPHRVVDHPLLRAAVAGVSGLDEHRKQRALVAPPPVPWKGGRYGDRNRK